MDDALSEPRPLPPHPPLIFWVEGKNAMEWPVRVVYGFDMACARRLVFAFFGFGIVGLLFQMLRFRRRWY